jgi:hypothetical protein
VTSNPRQGGVGPTLWNQIKAQVKDAAAKTKRSRPKPPLELTLWQWTLVPVILAGVRILIVSRGNSDTARALLQNLNVPAIFMATVLPVVTVGAVLLFSMGVITVIEQFRNRDQLAQQGKERNLWVQSLASSVILFVFAGVFVWYAMPWRSVFITGGLVVLLIAVFIGVWLSTRLKTLFARLGGLYLLALIVAGIVVVLAQRGVWMPRETLSANGSQTGVVYVLSSDAWWTKYMDDATRQIHIVPTQSIKGREPVHDDKRNWLNKTPSEALAG